MPMIVHRILPRMLLKTSPKIFSEKLSEVFPKIVPEIPKMLLEVLMKVPEMPKMIENDYTEMLEKVSEVLPEMIPEKPETPEKSKIFEKLGTPEKLPEKPGIPEMSNALKES